MEDQYSDLNPFSREEDIVLFSYWYPKVKDCGITMPQSVVIPVPMNVQDACCMDKPEQDRETIAEWVKREAMPAIEAGGLKGHLLFVKNGAFSNKFDARYCLCTEYELVDSIININYNALCLGAGGTQELVVRERYLYDRRNIPTIYNGLPLRNEFRVFYDFSRKEPIFTADYWDRDTMEKHLYDLTDRVIFDFIKESLHDEFENKKEEIEALVSEHMENVTGLEGPWSVDIMLLEDGTPVLIDMAPAERSAYWEMRPGNEFVLAAHRAAEEERRRKHEEFIQQQEAAEDRKDTCL